MNLSADPNDNNNILNEIIESATVKHIPDKTVKFYKHKHKKYKWITKGIINSISFRDKLYSKLKKTHPDTLQHMTLKINLSTYNNILTKNIRAATNVYYEACFEKSKHDICKTWSTINVILHKIRKKKSLPDVFQEDGTSISGKINIANKLIFCFTNIGSNLATRIISPDKQAL